MIIGSTGSSEDSATEHPHSTDAACWRRLREYHPSDVSDTGFATEARRLKELKVENAQLRRRVA
jgi:hypothetical protein